METISYSRGRLLGLALFMAAVAIWFVLIFLDPDSAGHSRRARFLHSGFGHYVFVPAIILCGAMASWRSASTAFGDLKALEATPAHLIAASFWGKRKIAWRDLDDAHVRTIRTGYWTQYQLMVKTGAGGLFGGKTIRIPLAGTGLSEADMPALLAGIAQARARAIASPGTLAVPAAVPEDELAGNFDPDAALARYLARKGSGQVDVSLPQPALAPRPAFGRKGL